MTEYLYAAFAIASQVWMTDKRDQALDFTCEQIAELDDCTAVIISDERGEFYRMKENVLHCRWLRYFPKSFSMVISSGCGCEAEHEIMLAIPYDRGCAAYVFLREYCEECVQVLKDIFVLISNCLRAMRIREENRIMVERLKENLEHFAFLSDRLRNPLAVILGVTELEGEIDVDRAFELIRKNALRIKETLDELSLEEVRTIKLTQEFEG